MLYKSIFTLQGTAQQIAIVSAALDQIHFPWTVLSPPKGTFTIGWGSLNSVALSGKLHKGDHPGSDTGTDTIEGEIEGRRYTLGVFYPSTGNSYIDNALVNYPELARTTVSAELAHLCDFFLPLSDHQKREISALMHGGSYADHGHSWWEKASYAGEYYTLVGESFMQAFTLAYSDMEFDASAFTHSITKEQAPALRAILGFERTDYVPPTVYKRFGKSKVYHTLEHYGNDPDATEITDTAGLRPCKICKP